MTIRLPGYGAIAGLVLAGGLSRRMGGGDKGLKLLGGRPILAHVIERLRPQVDAMVLNANGDPVRFQEFGLDVAPDSVTGFVGPLAGILAGMDWARAQVEGATHIVSVAGDGPFLPHDLVRRLIDAASKAAQPLATASSGGWTHPVIGLWPLSLRDDLQSALAQEGLRKVDLWTQRHGIAVANFSVDPIDPFFNANDEAELRAAEKMLARLPAVG